MIELDELLCLLNDQYLYKYNTKLISGFDEPFYKAAKNGSSAEIQFSHDYIRSALHELAHWCVAGVERREIDDYGYWYAEDGRNQQQQDEFFKLEIKPQTIEWALSIVCGVKFEASVDNLNKSVVGVEEFKQSLHQQMQYYLANGFSKRVSEIIELLANFHQIINPCEFISLKTPEL
ncbi:MAG: elongation factor P hydroxylase [Proteobacteria bacterium]|nr:elongation factor P hydroxylase [Pseudomonadota bacterium]